MLANDSLMKDLQIKGLSYMDYNTFKISIKYDVPSSNFTEPELAMWYVLNNNWDSAHQTAQSINNKLGSWIHAYLHRIEGDLSNANYWYQRANLIPFQGSKEDEAEEIIRCIVEI